MPRSGQIIPEYLVPHVQTYINDNTTFEDFAATPDEGTRLVCVFASSRGEDGVIKTFNNLNEYIAEYGKPNYNLYGQPGYMPYAALKSGKCKVYCERVMPSDAKYANLVVAVKTKIDTETDPANPTLVVKFEALNTDVDNKQMLEVNLESVDNELDAEGFRAYPLLAIGAKGRGLYGNAFAVRITSDILSDRENQYKNYNFQVLDVESGINMVESFRGSLYPNAIVGKTSIYLEDVLNDDEYGSSKLFAKFSPKGFEDVYAQYQECFFDNNVPVSIEEFDIITGRTKNNKAIPNLRIEVAEGVPALDSAEGILLGGGTDGAFDTTIPTETRQAAIDAEYIKAMQGKEPYDKAITSKRRTPAELILDANYSAEVKAALVELILKRYDAYGMLDGGLLYTARDAELWLEENASVADFIICKEVSHAQIKDPFTGRAIPMTYPYFYAATIGNHDENYGNQTPFQGEKFAKLTGYIKNTVRPAIDADDLETKETLYTARANFIECIAEDSYIRGVQGTSQNNWSDLSEENNVRVLLEMKRKLEEYVSSKIYNFAEPEDRLRFTEAATRMFEPYIGNKCRTCSVYFDMNPWEEERSILHCYLSVVFRTMAKRGIIEIDINKRVSTTA